MSRCLDSWQRHCPEFELRKWDESTLAKDIPYVQNALKAKQWANLSNYMRLHAVYEHGGFYLDTDVELHTSLENLRQQKCFFGWQLEAPLDWAINNAVFGATAKHPFIGELRQAVSDDFDGLEHPPLSSPHLVSRKLIEKGLRQFSDEITQVEDITLYPRRYFYPYSFKEEFSESCVTPETICVHYWANSWAPPKPWLRFLSWDFWRHSLRRSSSNSPSLT